MRYNVTDNDLNIALKSGNMAFWKLNRNDKRTEAIIQFKKNLSGVTPIWSHRNSAIFIVCERYSWENVHSNLQMFLKPKIETSYIK